MRRSRVQAVVFAVLLVTSVVAMPMLHASPARAEGPLPQYSPHGESFYQSGYHAYGSQSPTPVISPLYGLLQQDLEPTGPNLTDPSLLPEERLAYAALRIDAVDVDDPQRRDQLNRTFEHLNASLDSYDTHRATDRAAFDEQALALHELSRATEDDHAEDFENVSLGILRASEQTAEIATRHANESRIRFASDLDQWDEDYVEQAISDAKAAIQRAENARAQIDESWSTERKIRQRGDVVDHYREADHHAKRALDTIEANAEPRLRLTQGQAFESNGTVLVPVQAVLTDVRPWTYEDAVVTIEGDTETANASPIEFGESWLAGSFATGTTFVEVDRDAANVTVTVNATDAAIPGRNVTASLALDLTDVIEERDTAEPRSDVTVADQDGRASVAVHGENLTTDDFQVTDETPAANQSFTASPVVRITNRTAFDNATVTLALDEDVDADENVSIYTWDPNSEAGWTPVETAIDAANGTASAEVDHFSFFAVFRVEEWEAIQSSTITLEDRHFATDEDGIPIDGSDDTRAVSIAGEPAFEIGHDLGIFVWHDPDEPELMHVTMNGDRHETGEIRIVDMVVEADGPIDQELRSFDTNDYDYDFDPDADEREHVRVLFGTGYDGVTIDTSSATAVTIDPRIAAPLPESEWYSWSASEREQWTKTVETHRDPSVVFLGEAEVSPASLPLRISNESATFETGVPTEGLIGYWPLDGADGTIPDHSGAGNHGQVVGDPAEPEEVPGVFNGTALNFTDTDAYVEIPSTEALRGGADARLTGSVWFNPQRAIPDSNIGLLGKQEGSERGDWGIAVRETCHQSPPRQLHCNGDGPPDVAYYSEVGMEDFWLAYGPIETERWHHAAFTLDQPNGTVKLYLDGELVAEVPDASRVSASTDVPVEIGAISYSGSYFDGIIDEARVYDRVLSDEEVRQLYDPVDPIDPTGPRLRDSSGDGIPDAVADANPVIPELVPLLSEEDARIDINPFEVDTSGDGILDNETIEVDWRIVEVGNETKLEATVVDAAHHPNMTDTDGDGLSDRQTLAGWQAHYTTSREDSIDYVTALQAAIEADEPDLSILDDAEAYLEIENVTANPMLADTDGDGLTDYEESDNSTHPRKVDTTGDGITDGDAAATDQADPTLFDVQGPAITVYPSNVHKPRFSFQVEYTTTFNARDPAGVREARVLLDGTVKDRFEEVRGTDTYLSRFHTSDLETIHDAMTGSTVTIEAEDENGNLASEIALERSTIYGEAARRLSGTGQAGAPVVSSLGTFSGITTAAGETASGVVNFGEFLAAFAGDPIGYLTAFDQIVSALAQVTNLPAIVAAIPAAVEQTQASQNPFNSTKEPVLNESYREGWYHGYVGWLVLEIAVPFGELARVVSSSARFQRAVDGLEDAGRLGRAALAAGSAAKTAYAPVRMANHALTRVLLAPLQLSTRAGGRLMAAAPTVGAKHAWAKAVARMDPRTARQLTDGGSTTIDDAFRSGVRVAWLSDEVDAVTIERAIARIDALDDSTLREAALRMFIHSESKGAEARILRLIAEMDDDALEAYLRLDVTNGDVVRIQLARFTYDDPNLFDVPRAQQFVKDAEVLAERNVKGFDDGPGSVIDSIPGYKSASNFRGDQYEMRVAVADDLDELESIGRVVERPNGEHITDIDIERQGEIVEAKNNMGEKDATDKLDKFVEAHQVNEIDLNNNKVVFTKPGGFIDSQKAAIRQHARNIEKQSGNGINDISVEFDDIDPVE